MTEYRNPTPTVDIIIELEQGERVVLIERKNPPLGWALPGASSTRASASSAPRCAKPSRRRGCRSS